MKPTIKKEQMKNGAIEKAVNSIIDGNNYREMMKHCEWEAVEYQVRHDVFLEWMQDEVIKALKNG